MNRWIPVIALVALTGFAQPLSAADPRLVSLLWDETQVVLIEGKTNVQTTIRFGEDELIENVAIGDSQAWQVTPNKRANLLFVKPLAERASTNMTVVTNRRTYLFDLVANPKATAPLYVLSFTYPEVVEAVPPRIVPGESPNAIEIAAATGLDPIVDPAELNFAWRKNGDRNLYPARIYDDGTATYLAWPLGAPIPAILIKDAEGVEGPVNFAVRGDVIVIAGVPRHIVLRSGKDHATLENTGPQGSPSALAILEGSRR